MQTIARKWSKITFLLLTLTIIAASITAVTGDSIALGIAAALLIATMTLRLTKFRCPQCHKWNTAPRLQKAKQPVVCP